MTVMTRPQGGHLSLPALGANYSSAPVTEDVQWQNRGLCRSGRYDPNLWYPEGPDSERKSAKPIKVCCTCPVMTQCRAWALAKHEIFGVWGGLSEGDRQSLWKGRVPRQSYLRRSRRRSVA
jgi:WhiB family transcriptional regulator, redox-sensing transcriptional regulator